MAMRKIVVAEASAKELRAFAETILALEVPAGADDAKIRALIAEAGFTAASFQMPEMGKSSAKTADDDSRRQKRTGPRGGVEYLIEIPMVEDIGGNRAVPVAVNGRVMLIPRGQEVWVPEAYIHVLENAVRSNYRPFSGDGLGGLVHDRDVLAYPFRFVA